MAATEEVTNNQNLAEPTSDMTDQVQYEEEALPESHEPPREEEKDSNSHSRPMSSRDRHDDGRDRAPSTHGNHDADGADKGSTCCTLCVRNLPSDMRNEHIRAEFSRFGEVIDCRVVINPVTKDSRGFGFVSFRSAAAAEDAMAQMDGVEMKGKHLRIEKAKRNRPHDPTPGEYKGPAVFMRSGASIKYDNRGRLKPGYVPYWDLPAPKNASQSRSSRRVNSLENDRRSFSREGGRYYRSMQYGPSTRAGARSDYASPYGRPAPARYETFRGDVSSAPYAARTPAAWSPREERRPAVQTSSWNGGQYDSGRYPPTRRSLDERPAVVPSRHGQAHDFPDYDRRGGYDRRAPASGYERRSRSPVAIERGLRHDDARMAAVAPVRHSTGVDAYGGRAPIRYPAVERRPSPMRRPAEYTPPSSYTKPARYSPHRSTAAPDAAAGIRYGAYRGGSRDRYDGAGSRPYHSRPSPGPSGGPRGGGPGLRRSSVSDVPPVDSRYRTGL